MTDYAAFVLLPPLLARLAVEAPRLNVRVRGIFGRDEALDLLDSGEATLAIGFPVEGSARILVRPLHDLNIWEHRASQAPSSVLTVADRLGRRRRVSRGERKIPRALAAVWAFPPEALPPAPEQEEELARSIAGAPIDLTAFAHEVAPLASKGAR